MAPTTKVESGSKKRFSSPSTTPASTASKWQRETANDVLDYHPKYLEDDDGDSKLKIVKDLFRAAYPGLDDPLDIWEAYQNDKESLDTAQDFVCCTVQSAWLMTMGAASQEPPPIAVIRSAMAQKHRNSLTIARCTDTDPWQNWLVAQRGGSKTFDRVVWDNAPMDLVSDPKLRAKYGPSTALPTSFPFTDEELSEIGAPLRKAMGWSK